MNSEAHVPDWLWQERLSRFRRLIDLNAPRSVIIAEAWLVLLGSAGGRWRAAWWCFRQALMNSLADLWVATCRLSCKIGLHFAYDDGLCSPTDLCICRLIAEDGEAEAETKET